MQICPLKIKALRQQNSWSQDLLAKMSGLSLRTIQRVEKDGTASSETLLSLASTFDVSPKILMPDTIDVQASWKRKQIMHSLIALIIVSSAITMLFVLGGEIRLFADSVSALFLLLFMYSGTVIAYGVNGLFKSVIGFKYMFTINITFSSATEYLSEIYKKQILFIYGAAAIGLLIGIIAIHGNYDQINNSLVLHQAYAVCLLVILYAAIWAEVILRPLAIKLSKNVAVD